MNRSPTFSKIRSKLAESRNNSPAYGSTRTQAIRPNQVSLAQNAGTFARLRFNAGPGGEVKIPVCVDYSCEFDAADFEVWQQQYLANVTEDTIFNLTGKSKKKNQDEESDIFGGEDFSGMASFSDHELLSEIDSMDPMERQYFMEELAIRSDFWDESEVLYE